MSDTTGYAAGHSIRPIGGRLVLDFLNTADWTDAGEVIGEKVTSVEDIRVWAERLQMPVGEPGPTVDAFHRLRAAIRPLFLDGGDKSEGVQALNDLMAAGASPLSLAGGTLEVARGGTLLHSIATSACALLADPRETARLKQCPATDCGWLFIDESRTGRRKWCSMETCGNRAKAKRHYTRHRERL